MRKLLIWDGDETLWDGTLLEGDTPKLSPGRWGMCRELSERGVLQSLASHNQPADAFGTLHALDLERFFVAPHADLNTPKPIMVGQIIERLGLTRAADAVYIDDNASHRAEVLSAWPEIAVYPPHDLGGVVDAEFSKPAYTEDDRLRVRRYKDEEMRVVASTSYNGDRLAFLRACQLRMEISHPAPADWPRLTDLVERSHRFSALARDFREPDLRDVERHLWIARVSDRFGDYGLSAVIADLQGWIPLLAVSCRLAGKGIASALLATMINKCPDYPHSATWQATSYNASLTELFEYHGFTVRKRGDMRRAKRPWSGPALAPDWIAM